MEEINSLQNERVKRIVKLQRKASFRRAEGLTVIEGVREVSRAIENGWRPTELWVCNDQFQGLEKRMGAGSVCFQCSEAVFEKITYRDHPDGILAVGPLVGKTLAELDLPDNPLILVAEGIEKPGNLGALLRTADGAGADAVIVCDPATDLNNPNVIRNSIGTLFYLPVAEASSAETIAFLEKRSIRILSAVPDAETDYTDCDLTGPLAVVVGAEDQGLSSHWKQELPAPAESSKPWKHLEVKIPMSGKNDSLNVSVSAAVLLYEAARQRKS
jgi:RNA methyltransferase, TrmH family